MPIYTFSFTVIKRLFIIVTLMVCIAVNAKNAEATEVWVDEALLFAKVLLAENTQKAEPSLAQIQSKLAKKQDAEKLEAYQQLAFIYLFDFREADYGAVKALYSSLLSQSTQGRFHDTQLVLDIFVASINPENRDEAITTLASLIESGALSDEANILAHAVYVYNRNFKRVTPITLNAIREARNAYAVSKKSQFAGLALALVSAYTSLTVQDYAKSNESYRRAYELSSKFDHLYFSAGNYLSNLTWMLRQTNALQHAIDINNSQLAHLSEDSRQNYAFFVYFACGVYQQLNDNFEASLACLRSAGELLEYAPERWEQWHTGMVISSVLAGEPDSAREHYAIFKQDERSRHQLSALSKMRLAKAYLDIENGDSKAAIKAINAYFINNANRQIEASRKLSMEYNAYIDTEIESLEKNLSLQNRLLQQQSVLNIFGIVIIIGLIVFVVFQMKSRKKQRILATYDSLTGMLNRRGFLEQLAKRLDKAKKEDSSVTLGLINIDGFKAINEVNGYDVGDKVLQNIAVRLKEHLAENVLIGRMGADEFSFSLPKLAHTKLIEKVGMALNEHLSKDIQFANLRFKASVSIGLSSYPDGASHVDQLIDCADFALQSCKKFQRGGVRLFNDSDRLLLEQRLRLETALAKAEADEFSLHYQAIVDARSEKLVGFEALARWHSPQLGLVSPLSFIPVAEQTGYIDKLSRLLLTKALEDASKWSQDLTLSFNLSTQDVNSLENAQKIKEIVMASPFPSARLIVEMTETAIVQDTATTREALRLLTETGACVALDDFGTGYSSINHLLDFEFSRIKLDRVLIDDIESDTNKVEIVQALLDLCANLNIDCVIEGVETDVQKQHLNRMKVDKFQGYLFSKPIPASEVPVFISNCM